MNNKAEVEFTNRELLIHMLKIKEIHKGHWMLIVHFGFNAMNIGQTDSGEDAAPAGVVSVQKIGIREIPQPLPFSVDAFAVNPPTKKAPKKQIHSK